jgi:hypothetical protein
VTMALTRALLQLASGLVSRSPAAAHHPTARTAGEASQRADAACQLCSTVPVQCMQTSRWRLSCDVAASQLPRLALTGHLIQLLKVHVT